MRGRIIEVWVVAVAVLQAAPAHAGLLVLSGLVANHEGAPGEVVRGVVRLANDGDTPWSGSVLLGDYCTDGTRLLFTDPGTVGRSSAAWTSFDAPTLSLAPHETYELHYQVRVPDEGEVHGTYWSTILLRDLAVEEIAVEAADPSAADVGFRLIQQSQIAVRVNVHVRQGANYKFDFLAVDVRGEGTGRTVDVDMANPGDLAAPTKVNVKLFDVGGAVVGESTSTSWSLYPGCWVRYSVPVGDVPPGEYQALIVADGGPDAVFGVRRAVVIP